MAGGWATALGAAILQGNQGYQQAKVANLENQGRALENKNRALQQAILQLQLANQPKELAAQRAKAIYELSPEEAFNNPEFLKLREQAGEPVNTLPNAPQAMLKTQLGLAESPDEMKPLDSVRGQAATQLGIAPDTGAVVPPELQFARVKREKEMASLDAQMKMINSLMGDASGAGDTGAPSSEQYDPADVRKRMLLKIGL